MGTVLDLCNCCKVCGAKLGDKCGGDFSGYPKCGRCLSCVLPKPDRFQSESGEWYVAPVVKGVCKLNCAEPRCAEKPVPECKQK